MGVVWVILCPGCCVDFIHLIWGEGILVSSYVHVGIERSKLGLFFPFKLRRSEILFCLI